MNEALEDLLFRILRVLRCMCLYRLMRTQLSTRPFTVCFPGLEKHEAVQGIFGQDAERVLRSLRVEFTLLGGYMWIDNADGHLVINRRYLEKGDVIDIYLDLIHELYHVKQFREGRQLFDHRYAYVERPTEVEAYMYTVKVARQLGLSDERICRYLKTEWISPDDLRRLARKVGVNCSEAAQHK